MSRRLRARKARGHRGNAAMSAQYAVSMTVRPASLPLFPLESVVLFPGVRAPLHIFEPRYRQMMESALRGDRAIGMATVLPEHRDQMAGAPPLFAIGCAGFIEAYERLPDGRFNLLLLGTARFRTVRELEPEAGRLFRVAEVDWLEDEEPAQGGAAEVDAARAHVMDALREILVRSGRAVEDLVSEPLAALDATTFTNTVCQMLALPAEEKHSLLAADGTVRRILALEGLLALHLARLKLPFGRTDTLH
jgi:Lon protease-like protein